MGKLHTWWAGIKPRRGTLKASVIAAAPRTAAGVPDGMAAAALVGVNPIHGLYASFAGPVVGGLTASTKLMVITTTSAASLAAFSALQGVPRDARLSSLFLMVAIAGVLMVLAGFFGLGRFASFVSQSVMTGFLTGVAVSILLGQIPALLGATVEASGPIEEAARAVFGAGSIDGPSMIVGVAALALLALLPMTPLSRYAALIALIVPSVIVVVSPYFDSVLQVGDVGEIVRGIPVPALPSLRVFSLDVLTGAFAVAVIVLVQGAGVAQSYPNPDRTRSDQNTDFMAQGWSNVAVGLFQGTPVGGSVSQTALNVSAGARDRWASILSGVFMLLVLVAFSGLAEQVANPTLAAILIVASLGAIRPGQITAVWRSGMRSRVAMAFTFVATLTLPVAAAVGVGVALSLLLAADREAKDVRIVEMIEGDDGSLIERPAPSTLASESVTVLNLYGSLFYAGARTLENDLPPPGDAERPVVVLRIRGTATVGATAFSILSSYADELSARGGRLYLSGVDRALVEQFESSGRIEATGSITLVEATPTIGESTRAAVEEANTFLLSAPIEPLPDESDPWAKRVVGGIAHRFGWSHTDDGSDGSDSGSTDE